MALPYLPEQHKSKGDHHSSQEHHPSISGPYQDHQLSLHTPHKKLKNLICLSFTPFNPHINLSFLTLPPNIPPPLALISKKDFSTKSKK